MTTLLQASSQCCYFSPDPSPDTTYLLLLVILIPTCFQLSLELTVVFDDRWYLRSEKPRIGDMFPYQSHVDNITSMEWYGVLKRKYFLRGYICAFLPFYYTKYSLFPTLCPMQVTLQSPKDLACDIRITNTSQIGVGQLHWCRYIWAFAKMINEEWELFRLRTLVWS